MDTVSVYTVKQVHTTDQGWRKDSKVGGSNVCNYGSDSLQSCKGVGWGGGGHAPPENLDSLREAFHLLV